MLLAALLPALLFTGRVAAAHELEVGAFGGVHLFMEDDELGRLDRLPVDTQTAPSFLAGMGGLRLSYAPLHFMALEAEVAAIPATLRSGPWLVAVAYRGHLLFHLAAARWRVKPFVLVGGGAISSVYSEDQNQHSLDTDLLFHGGAGLKAYLGKKRNVVLRLDGRVLLPPRVQDNGVTQGYEVLLGVGGHFDLARKAPPPPPVNTDRDGDGVLDKDDQCPDEPGLAENQGCPPRDSDGDGVLDKDDKCPAKAGPVENQGCPDEDKDSDGIVDRLDRCPDKAGLAAYQGCPPPDQDGDGILDAEDRCPDKAGPKALGGCPDSDGDGLADKDDKCPDKAETRNGYQDEDGCPDEIPQAMARFTGVIEGIRFATNKAVIVKTSFKLLDKAVAVLKEFDTVRLEISGHTDNTGKPEKNTVLSQQRADAVKAYLVKQGVAEGRLVAKGYGPDKPIADNKTSKGKAKNRRVEFQLILSGAPATPAAPTPAAPAPAAPAPAAPAPAAP